MASSKKRIIRCTPEEDAIINAQIAANPDEREWTDEDFANALTTPELVAKYPHLAKLPQFAPFAQNPPPAGEPVSVGIDPDIVGHFRKSGAGWKKRLNQTLRDAVFGGGETGE